MCASESVGAHQCDQILAKLYHFGKKMKIFWQFFEGLISFWRGNVEPTFTIFLLLENFQRDKWPNIKK